MAITYIGTSVRPGDNSGLGGNASNPLLLKTGGVTTGDLVMVVGQYRGTTTIEVDETAGQTWHTLTPFTDAANLCTVQIFWCRWDDAVYNGNNPNWWPNGVGTVPFTCTGHIFRPTSSGNQWAVDVALTSTQHSAPSTPFTVTRNGVTTTNANTVSVATWHTADVNTWGSISGTGWTVLGDPQFRNTTGSGQSSSLAYKIMTSAGATGNVSKNQATNGGDAGVTSIISFYEFGSGSITGNTSGSGSLSATLIAIGKLAATLTCIAAQTALLTAPVAISGSTIGSVAVSGNLTGTGARPASSAGTVSFSAGLNGIGSLSGVVTGNTTLSSTATGTGIITANLSVAGTGNASLIGVGALLGDINGSSTAFGTAFAGGTITSQAFGTSVGIATISGIGPLSASIQANSSLNATLVCLAILNGGVISRTTLVAVLEASGLLVGVAFGSVSLIGQLDSGSPSLQGAAVGFSSCSLLYAAVLVKLTSKIPDNITAISTINSNLIYESTI